MRQHRAPPGVPGLVGSAGVPAWSRAGAVRAVGGAVLGLDRRLSPGRLGRRARGGAGLRIVGLRRRRRQRRPCGRRGCGGSRGRRLAAGWRRRWHAGGGRGGRRRRSGATAGALGWAPRRQSSCGRAQPLPQRLPRLRGLRRIPDRNRPSSGFLAEVSGAGWPVGARRLPGGRERDGRRGRRPGLSVRGAKGLVGAGRAGSDRSGRSGRWRHRVGAAGRGSRPKAGCGRRTGVRLGGGHRTRGSCRARPWPPAATSGRQLLVAALAVLTVAAGAVLPVGGRTGGRLARGAITHCHPHRPPLTPAARRRPSGPRLREPSPNPKVRRALLPLPSSRD